MTRHVTDWKGERLPLPLPHVRQLVGELLDLAQDEVPPLRLKWCHLSQDESGEIVGCCSKMPSDLEAKIGVHHRDTRHLIRVTVVDEA